MKISKYTNDPETLAYVGRLERGEITRTALAAEIGLPLSSLNTRIKRGGFSERLANTRQYCGQHAFKPDPDKAKVYEAAVEVALSSPRLKVTALHARFPDLSYQMLARKVKEARGLHRTQEDRATEETVERLRQELAQPTTP